MRFILIITGILLLKLGNQIFLLHRKSEKNNHKASKHLSYNVMHPGLYDSYKGTYTLPLEMVYILLTTLGDVGRFRCVPGVPRLVHVARG